MAEEIASVPMTHAFHEWVAGKTNCEVFDTTCETDKDCDMACSALHSEDGRELTRFVCNNESGRCNRAVYNSDSYAKASKDLGNILHLLNTDKIYAALIPENFLWFIKHNNGRLFVDKRAAYYDLMGMALGQLENTDTLVKIMERRNAESLRERLHRKLDLVVANLTKEQYRKANQWIRDVTAEAQDDDDDEVKPSGTSLEHFLRGITGYTRDGPVFIIDEGPSTPVELKRISKTKLRNEQRNSALRSKPEDLCNEHLHAGRAEAIYEDETTGERVAVCSCTYPEYLTGPTCHQRTYRHVVDYDAWAATGWPEFLVDPVWHFEKADDVCRGLARSAVAEYSQEDRSFSCVTVADLVKNSLTFRGAYEPSLLIERDVNKAENAPSETFGLNWKYVNLLERLERRI